MQMTMPKATIIGIIMMGCAVILFINGIVLAQIIGWIPLAGFFGYKSVGWSRKDQYYDNTPTSAVLGYYMLTLISLLMMWGTLTDGIATLSV